MSKAVEIYWLKEQIKELKMEMLRRMMTEVEDRLEKVDSHNIDNYPQKMEMLHKIKRLLDGEKYVF